MFAANLTYCSKRPLQGRDTQRNVESGMLSGVSVDLACELARELGMKLDLVPFDAAGKAFESIAIGDCHVGFLTIDPERAARLSYTAPYVLLHGGYLMHKSSPFVKAVDVDQPGVRIAAVRNTAYDLYLSRTLRYAELVYATTSAGSVDLLLGDCADVAAGIYKSLAETASSQPRRLASANSAANGRICGRATPERHAPAEVFPDIAAQRALRTRATRVLALFRSTKSSRSST
jgi:polar amino acid transport system substrate-binding protein